MIEIYRKGFRLDIPPEQIVTFKKAQNLNGIQARYAYSNTGSADLTANNRKLLELFELPTSKVSTLMNGFTVDVVLNGSIQLKNQTLTITKENKKTFDWYLLYSDNALVVKLKEQYMNLITSDLLYKKNVSDFYAKQESTIARSAFVETQEKSGLYVIEEMPILIQMQELIRRIFTSNGYSVYGDFFLTDNTIKDYYVAPNQGVYQVYSGSGEGFTPVFSSDIDLFTFLTWALQFFNCYAVVDDTYKTVVINQWTNLSNFKTGYIDYSKYYVDYKDYIFQSKLAKVNDLTYSDSGTTFNSFFSNTLSSQAKAVYLASAFGAGTLSIFDDSEIDPETGTIEVRPNGAVGESSAVRIMKVSPIANTSTVYVGGVPQPVVGIKAIPVSMRDVYTEFHKEYTDFILTPLIQNLIFKYDDILAADFSMTRVFFIEQQSSYWIPLEINYSTKKDNITVKAMLVKKRKVPSPILNDFNSILLDFKEKGVFPLEYLLAMYPMPPNQYPIQDVIFKSYDETKNRLYVNDVFIPAASLPQAFSQETLLSIKIEANAPGDTTPDTNSSSLYIQVVDTNGGISNEAFINIKHTGVASLESNFVQPAPYLFTQTGLTGEHNFYINALSYTIGLKPNLNSTVTSVGPVNNATGPDTSFDLIQAAEPYDQVYIKTKPFTVRLKVSAIPLSKGLLKAQLHVSSGGANTVYWEQNVLKSVSSSVPAESTFTVPALNILDPALNTGEKIRVYFSIFTDHTFVGDMDIEVEIVGANADISTIKTI